MTKDDRAQEPIVGLRFSPSDRVRYFAARGVSVSVGDTVEVETDLGPREGVVIIAPEQVRYANLRGPLDAVTRRMEP